MQSCCRGYLTSIKSNDEYGCRFPVSADTCYIGGDSNCDICIKELDVKERQCLIRATFNKVTVYNLCPDNPVLVNNIPVSDQGYPLNQYDKITIFNTTFQWENSTEKPQQRYSVPVSANEVIDAGFAQRYSDPNFRSPTNEETNKMFMESAPSQTCDVSNSAIDTNKQASTVITPENSPRKIDVYSSEVKRLTSSCPRNSTLNNEIPRRLSNSSSKEIRFARGSRLFGKTHKATKSCFDSPEKRKTDAAARKYFAKITTPLQENRTPSKEVKSRFEFRRSSLRKSVTRLSFNVASTAVDDLEKSCPKTLLGGDKQWICSNNVDNSIKDSNQKEDTLKDMTSVLSNTFETTIVNETAVNQSVPLSAKCFTKTHHSTPKCVSEDKAETFSNLSIKTSDNVTSMNHDTISVCPDRSNDTTLPDRSLFASPVVLTSRVSSYFIEDTPKNDIESHHTTHKVKSKKKENDLSRTADSPVEVRRNTRNRSNILKKTLEECNEDNLTSNELSQTTPEKGTGETVSSKIITLEETDFDSYSPEKNLDHRYGSESEKTPFESSIHQSSSEKKEHISAAENVEKSHRSEDSFSRMDVARCTRNLSYISPPENNKSQEFMDSVVSTPKKMSFKDNEVTASPVTNLNMQSETISGESSVCTPKSPTSSSSRNRRSTGFVPFVGTPSEVYRTNKGVLTPAIKSRFNRPSMEVVQNAGARDSFSAVLKCKQLYRQQPSERKSTPLKAEKSSIRDSLQLHSPIIEDYSLEFEEESQNESNNDSQFKFVSKRKRRMCKSSFAIENRIMEESESVHSEVTDVNVEVEDSFMPLPSFVAEDSAIDCDRIVVNQIDSDDNSNVTNDDENVFNSTYNIDSDDENGSQPQCDVEKSSPVKSHPIPKSILTPLPRCPMDKEKSAKKVTFVGLKEGDYTDNTSTSAYSPSDTIHDLDSVVSLTSENESQSQVEEESGVDSLEDDALYVSDKSSVQSDSSVPNPLEKCSDSNGESEKIADKSPSLLGVRSLFTSFKSPNCNYLDVSGVERLMETPETETELAEILPESSILSSGDNSLKAEDASISPELEQCFQQSSSKPTHLCKSAEVISDSLAQELSTNSLTKSTIGETVGPESTQLILKNGDMSENIALKLDEERVNVELVTPEGKPSDTDRSDAIRENYSVFRTPTMRRCSKHFRIHRSSLCQTINTNNSPEAVEPSLHDCSASLDNSLVEPAISDTADLSRSPKSNFQKVLVELKSKLDDLCKKSASQTNFVALEESEEGTEQSADVSAEAHVEFMRSNSPVATEDCNAEMNTTTESNVPYTVESVPQIVITPASANTTIINTNEVQEAADKFSAPKDTFAEYSAITNDTFKTCSLISNSSFPVVESGTPVIFKPEEKVDDERSAVSELKIKNDVCSNEREQEVSECSGQVMELKMTDDSFHEKEKVSTSASSPILGAKARDDSFQENASVPVADPVLPAESTNSVQPSSPANSAELVETSNRGLEGSTVVLQDDKKSVPTSENAEIRSSSGSDCVPFNDVINKPLEKDSDPVEEFSQSSQQKETLSQSPGSAVITDSKETSVDLIHDIEEETETALSDSLLSQISPEHSENSTENWTSPSEEESSKLTTAEQSPLACSTKIGTSDLGVAHFQSPQSPVATHFVASKHEEKTGELLLVSSAPVLHLVESEGSSICPPSPVRTLPKIISVDPNTFCSKRPGENPKTKVSVSAVEENTYQPAQVLCEEDETPAIGIPCEPVTNKSEVNVVKDVVTCTGISSEAAVVEITSSQADTITNEDLSEESNFEKVCHERDGAMPNETTEANVNEPEMSGEPAAPLRSEPENLVTVETIKSSSREGSTIGELSVIPENVKEASSNETTDTLPESRRSIKSLNKGNNTIVEVIEKEPSAEVEGAKEMKTIDKEVISVNAKVSEVKQTAVVEIPIAKIPSASTSPGLIPKFDAENTSSQSAESNKSNTRLSVVIEELPEILISTTSLPKRKRITRKETNTKKEETNTNTEGEAKETGQLTQDASIRGRRTRSVLRNNPEPTLPNKTNDKKKLGTTNVTGIQVNIPRIGLVENTKDIAISKNETIESNNIVDNEQKTKKAVRTKRTAMIAQSREEAPSPRKLRSASVKPDGKPRIRSATLPRSNKLCEELVNPCSIVLPVLVSITKDCKAPIKANAMPKTAVLENELMMQPVKPKRVNRKLKVTFSTEDIPQVLNDSSDKENTIELTNRGRKPRSRKDESTSNEIVETKTRRNRKVETTENHVLIEKGLKKVVKKSNNLPKSTTAKNTIETSAEKVENRRRTTRSAKNTAKDESVKAVEPKKVSKVGARVVLEVVQVEEVEPQTKKSNKRGAKITREEKKSIPEKTMSSKRQKSTVEKEAPVSRSRAVHKGALPMAENTTNNARVTRNRNYQQPTQPEIRSTKPKGNDTPTLSINIARADVPKTKATKRTATELEGEDVKKRRRISEEDPRVSNGKVVRGKKFSKEVKQNLKTKTEASKKRGKMTGKANSLDVDVNTSSQASSSVSTKSEHPSLKSTMRSKKEKEINVTVPRVTRSQKRQISSTRSNKAKK